MATKAKIITERRSHFAMLGHIEREVQVRIKLRIICKMIYGWRNSAIGYSFNARDRFNGPGRAKTVAGH